MAVTIPIVRTDDQATHFEQQASLDGVTYTLEFRWNVRLQAWFMHVFDSQGITPLAVGLRLVANYPLLRFASDRSPPGFFVLRDTGAPDGSAEEPGFQDLGSRHQLGYLTKADLG